MITTLDIGGAQSVLAEVLAGAADRGVSGDVVVLGPLGPVGERLRAAGTPVRALDLSPAGLPMAVATLRVHRRRRRPDVMATWLYHADVVATLAVLGTDVPLLWSVHHTDLPATQWPAHTRLAARAARSMVARVDRIVFTSHAARDLHVARGYPAARSEIVPNGVAAPAPRPDAGVWLRRSHDIPWDAPVVVAVGRAHPQKDLPTFVRAVAVASERHPGLHAVIAGEGTDRDPAIRRAVAATRLGGRIRLLGVRDDVPDLLAGADVVVSSSSSGESCPVVVLEAMAVGTPVVATDVGDARRILGHAGTVVPPGSPRRLGGAIADLLALPVQEREVCAAAGRDRVRGRYGRDAMVGGHLAAWRAAVARRRQR